MSTQLKPFLPQEEPSPRRRAAWRQRLVDAERGITLGYRGDSAFFVQFFAATIVIVAALVLGFSYIEWAVAVLALTFVLAAEMFNQVLKTILSSVGRYLGDDVRKALRIGTAAVFVTNVGAVVALVLVFGKHVLGIFAE